MLKWLKRAREERKIDEMLRFGPPYIGKVGELSDLLQSDYATKRIKPGHA